MEPGRTNTYLIKIRSCARFPIFRKQFLTLLKEVEYIQAVEQTSNKYCFYIETHTPEDLENFLDRMNEEFKQSKLGDVIYSQIQNVFLTKKKGIANAR